MDFINVLFHPIPTSHYNRYTSYKPNYHYFYNLIDLRVSEYHRECEKEMKPLFFFCYYDHFPYRYWNTTYLFPSGDCIG